jgi:hypothetical protein
MDFRNKMELIEIKENRNQKLKIRKKERRWMMAH